MKKVTIELDREWVLQCRSDEKLPITLLTEKLEELGCVEIKYSSFNELDFLIDEEKTDVGGIEQKIAGIFASAYPDADLKTVLSVKLTDYDEAEEKRKAEEAEKAEEEKRQKEKEKEKEEDGASYDDLSKSKKIPSLEVMIKLVNYMVGAAEYKELVNEIVKVAPEIIRTNNYDVFTNRSYLFSIGEGCGLSTYMFYLAILVSRLKLAKMAARPVVECKLDPYRDDMLPFHDTISELEDGDSNAVKVMCIDISEWMDRTDNKNFKQFLKTVERYSDRFIVVFRIPFVEKDVLERVKFSLGDLLSIREVSIPPFNAEEIQLAAKRQIKSMGLTVSKSAWQHFHRRISVEKSDGKFYGLNTVKKVVRELVYSKQLSNAGKKKKSTKISDGDMLAICGKSGNGMSGMEQLSKLVGNEKLKEKIDEIIAQIELTVNENSAERPCIHMRFVGNPGTGKTTVARIIGKILKERGVLRLGNFFECSGRDLCGRYIGETAPKTSSICRDAYGSVLFIDEAYSLYRGDDNSRDYGREAIDTLIAEMENHKDDFVVIMAGYTDEMNNLMKGNIGLASRMPYTIEFPNFSREQLFEIYCSMVKSSFKYDESLLEAAKAYFNSLPDEFLNAKEFSNARFVRNLFERTWAKAAMRRQLGNRQEVVLTKEDFERASSEKDFNLNNNNKTHIGF